MMSINGEYLASHVENIRTMSVTMTNQVPDMTSRMIPTAKVQAIDISGPDKLREYGAEEHQRLGVGQVGVKPQAK